MRINKLSLINFKNYKEINIELHPKLNCFVGNNGVGKTNLLDAIYYLCMCKSYFNATDQYTIRNSEPYMMIRAEFELNTKVDEIQCAIQREKKKQFRKNKKEYSRLSDHIGIYPVVMVSPADIQLIIGGGEERRKYINSVISQYNKSYLEATINYNKVLLQRNKLLKDLTNRSGKEELIDIYDIQLAELGTLIYNERIHFIKHFLPVFERLYSFISNKDEKVELYYQSQLGKGDYISLLHEARKRDISLQHTSIGIHKDDLVLHLGGAPIKKVGSQGQQKTYLVSLKLAQFEFFREVKKIKPVLLLDDVFDKFDADRVRQILLLVGEESYGQICITHTNLDRMNTILSDLNISHKLFYVNQDQGISELEEGIAPV